MFIIMKVTSRPGCIDWVRPHCAYDGSVKDAGAYCKQLNERARDNDYYVEKVKVIKGEQK